MIKKLELPYENIYSEIKGIVDQFIYKRINAEVRMIAGYKVLIFNKKLR